LSISSEAVSEAVDSSATAAAPGVSGQVAERPKPAGLALLGLVVLLTLAAPLYVPASHAVLLLKFFGYSIVLLGLNLLFGYTGLLSFGQALFLAIGAYVTAVCTSRLDIRSMEVILLLAVAVSLAVAAPVGALCVRYVRIYFGMLTLAFSMLFYSFLIKFSDLTNGDQGINVRSPVLLGSLAASPGDPIGFLLGPYFYYCAAILLALGYVMWRIVRSPFGLCLRAVREQPQKAEYLGVSVKRFRWYAYLIAAVYGGIGGALLAPTANLADPTMSYWTESGNLVFMTVLGGFASFLGPLLGSFIFIYLQDFVMARTEYWRFVFGVILVAIVVLAPRGLMGLLEALPGQLRRRMG
jgi:branched-chain amino acid transport system permease protein